MKTLGKEKCDFYSRFFLYYKKIVKCFLAMHCKNFVFRNTKSEVTIGERGQSKNQMWCLEVWFFQLSLSLFRNPCFQYSKLTNSVSRVLDFAHLLTTEMVKTRWLSG